MAENESQVSRAEQRAFAVAKLKRAASLPRMKDGRRPPMHTEAVSEGEKVATEAAAVEPTSTETEMPIQGVEEPVLRDQELSIDVDRGESELRKDDDDSPPPDTQGTEAEMEADAEVDDRSFSPGPTRAKRRSRSRSRSRNSKDFKGKTRATQSPTPVVPGDSSDEAPPMPIALPMIPPLVSPIPSHFAAFQASHLLRSPYPASPEPNAYPNTSPSTPMLLPTFEALLIRSNSAGSAAASRRLAMQKLTGGTEDYDPSPSPAPPPMPGKLGRNNTVAGGERFAARQLMLSRLTGRITKEADVEASGEERSAPSPTPKRRRRRSRRGSSAAIPAVSDSEPLSPSPNTLLVSHPPFSPPLDSFNELRAESATPNQAISSRNQSNERVAQLPPLEPQPQPESDFQEPRRRSILIEDDLEDEEDRYSPLSKNPAIANTPPLPRSSPHIAGLRSPHSSDSPASHSTDSVPNPAASTVPVYMDRGSPARTDRFPSSPFTTPLKEKPLSDDDEEQVLYPAEMFRPRTPYATNVDAYEREISWVASIVPEIRMPIDDDDDDEEEDEAEQETEVVVHDDQERYQEYEEDPLSATSSSGFSPPEAYDDTSPRVSSSSKSVVIESEASADILASHLPPFLSAAALSQTPSYAYVSDGSGSPPTYPTRLSIASRIQQNGERSPLNGEYTDWEDRLISSEPLVKRPGESASPSTWEKVKNTFSRSASSSGRRSRTNSIVNRERHSSVSRESGASLNSGKTDRGDSLTGFTQQPIAPPLMQSPSASASILSLSPHATSRGNPSPIPPVGSVDMSKYQSDKLFPFPGMKRGFPMGSASTPDVSVLSNGPDDVHTPLSVQSFTATPAQTPDMNRERKLSHQTSDSRLNMRYGPDIQSLSPIRQEYIDVMPASAASTSSGGLKPKLPMTFTDVKHWLSKNNKKRVQPLQTPSSAVLVTFSPSLESQNSSTNSNKKPSLSDLLRTEKPDLNPDWEDVGNTPTSGDGNGDILNGQATQVLEHSGTGRETPAPVTNGSHTVPTDQTETERTPKAKKILPLNITSPSERPYLNFDAPAANPARVERNLTITPDPSSVSDDPPQSTSESSSTTSSQYSLGQGQGSVLLERLDENLSRGSAPIDEPPRKLLLSSHVLQVVNPNTVKDRFLFLFTDILVIAKPITQDHDSFMEAYKPSPPDRKCIVKSVVRLRTLRFCQDRTEPQPKSSNYSAAPRSPALRSFVSQFSKDPDQAITSLFSKSSLPLDSSVLGHLLFKTLDLDRCQLGDYLSRRTSKAVLKSYLDRFGFAGLRIDVSLRVFLHSINVPLRSPQTNPGLDHLLDSFASRWYEANAKIVAYDKDMAIRLVRMLVQLNEHLHGGIADDIGPTGLIRRDVTGRDFSDAFRRYDPRRLVSDDLLDDVYTSIREDRLTQARPSPSVGPPNISITFKRPLPARLTYKIQSDPVIIRLPQADPLLTLHLYGQDLVFEPPTLTFPKSPEASFRVSGTSLGSKTMVICRSGPNATKYVGLPLSYMIPIERAFMRNTFQLAFTNHNKTQRRYMFSVEDHLLRHQWAQSIKLQIDRSLSTSAVPSETSPGASGFFRAAEEVAFKVLQETLISERLSPSEWKPRVPHHGKSPTFSSFSDKESSQPSPNVHIRSKSRSKMYHRYGAGKYELELSNNSHKHSSSRENNDPDPDESFFFEHSGHFDGKIWSSRELEVQCQQNSLIPTVLSYLQFGVGTS